MVSFYCIKILVDGINVDWEVFLHRCFIMKTWLPLFQLVKSLIVE